MTAASVLDDLRARGLVQDCTDPEGLAARLAEGPVSLYYGCDPTADSLHVGNLLGLLVLRRFQDAGHRAVALAGGATGMVGDPSGRSEERNLLDQETLEHNVAAIKEQISRIVDLTGDRGTLVDNREWTEGVGVLEFLRDVGKHVTVNTMLARESVKQRIGSEHGISFTEFSYMLLQAHDFLRLEERHAVQVQIGGSDQWGNMLGGVDLIRRVHGRPAWVLSWPLLTAPDGTKLGKTTGARIWLDAARTSPYQFFQHWMATDDRQVRQFLLQFTLLPVEEVDALVALAEADPGKRLAHRRLAVEATRLVHGHAQAAAAEEASAVLFGAPLDDASPEALAMVGAEVGTVAIDRQALEAGIDLVELMAAHGEAVASGGLAGSKGEARRAIAQGGVYVNGERVADGALLTDADLRHGRYVLVRRGKKVYGLADAGTA